ncbi:MAG TPA: hypothetical protein VES95_13205 [Dermatophilaceae bacterium]|nr:hypothetical protein [Dermatophilaceae bacterium]
MSFSHQDDPFDAPLTDPVAAADVVDLVTDRGSREAGCLTVLLCGEDGVPLSGPIVIDDVPLALSGDELAGPLGSLAAAMAHLAPAFVVARGRPGGVRFTDLDRGWHQALLEASREHGIRLLGAYLATPEAVRPFPDWLVAAS